MEEGYENSLNFTESAKNCAEIMGINYKGIQECIIGKEGAEIMHEIA